MTEPSDAQSTPHLLDPDTFARYLVTDQREVLQILEGLVEKRALLTIHIGDDQFVSVLLRLASDAQSLYFDAAPDDALNQHAVAQDGLVCSARLDSIRIQFAVDSIRATTHDGYPALQASLPTSVLRLQRREFFRLPAPNATPLICALTLGEAVGATHTVEVRILDISAGGVAVVVPPEGVDFSPGMEFDDCSLRLPDGPIPVSLRVRNLFHVDMRNNVRLLRAGCEFVGLPAGAVNRIQRYIFRIERERNARDNGL